MGDKGRKDKGKREQQKKAQLNPKEKRRLKKEKKKKWVFRGICGYNPKLTCKVKKENDEAPSEHILNA
jgi:hypothetical protein